MEQEINWTKIAVTFIKSFFRFISGKGKSRRTNGDSSSES